MGVGGRGEFLEERGRFAKPRGFAKPTAGSANFLGRGVVS